MSQRSSHTHCQVAQADTRPKLVKECACPNARGASAAKLIDNEINKQKSPVPNKRYKTLGFKWLCKVSTPHQSLLSGDSDVARNPQRFHTANRYRQCWVTSN